MSRRPEENIARRVIRRHSLQLPIDVASLARKYAEVEEVEIPYEVDGITLNLKDFKRSPRIFLNASATHRRRRFTLAHELGHILIPWHLGNIVDVTSDRSLAMTEANDYWTIESEANRFASELLMPSAWVNGLVATSHDPKMLTETICMEAEVLPIAATIKLINALPVGFVYAQINRDGSVVTSGRTPNTIASAPSWGSAIHDPSNLFPSATNHRELSVGAHSYHWWEFPRSISLPKSPEDDDWRALLETIVSDAGYEGQEAVKIKQSMNGVVSFANSRSLRETGRRRETLYAACLQRFQSNESMSKVRGHSLFSRYLAARIRALVDR